MNGATSIHPMTSLAPRAEPPKPGPRTTMRGGVVLMLAWTVLASTFLLDVARPPAGHGAGVSASTAQPEAPARSSPAPRSP